MGETYVWTNHAKQRLRERFDLEESDICLDALEDVSKSRRQLLMAMRIGRGKDETLWKWHHQLRAVFVLGRDTLFNRFVVVTVIGPVIFTTKGEINARERHHAWKDRRLSGWRPKRKRKPRAFRKRAG